MSVGSHVNVKLQKYVINGQFCHRILAMYVLVLRQTLAQYAY
jgi:hypothetical protein